MQDKCPLLFRKERIMTTLKGSTTRQRILEQGLELASQQGLTGVSIGRLAQQTRLSKSGLFAHFGSVEALQIELLQHAAELANKDVVAPALLEAKGLPRLQKLFDRLLGWAERAGLPGGCPFVGASVEFDDREGAVRDYVVTTLETFISVFQDLIREAVAEKHLRQGINAKYVAWQMFGIYTMHHTMQRLLHDPEADKLARQAFQSLLSPYITSSKSKKKSRS
jgi:AcrR family transcriptional regulator